MARRSPRNKEPTADESFEEVPVEDKAPSKTKGKAAASGSRTPKSGSAPSAKPSNKRKTAAPAIEEEEATPAAAKKKTAKKAAVVEEEEEDEEEEEEEEEKEKEKQTPKRSPKKKAAVEEEEEDLKAMGIRVRPGSLPKVEILDKALGSGDASDDFYAGMRRPFTPEEEDAITAGVAKYPPIVVKGLQMYQWSRILNDPTFRVVFHRSRTPVSLKDKWRTMQRKLGLVPKSVMSAETRARLNVKPSGKGKIGTSLWTINVLGPDGDPLGQTTVVHWSPVASFCQQVLGAFGKTTEGSIIFPSPSADNGYAAFDKATEMTTTVKEAGAVPNGPCIIVPKYTQ